MNKTSRTSDEADSVFTPEAAAAPTTPSNPMERYKIRVKANTARRIYLLDPGTREKTEDWVDVVSSLSDNFRDARDQELQKAAEIGAIPHLETRLKANRESQLAMYASLVTGWSFPTPCTKKEVIEFLRDSPQVQDIIVDAADERENFFVNA